MSFKRQMRGLSLRDIKITDPFWAGWQETLVEKTLPQQFDQLETSGRFSNFRKVIGTEEGPFEGFRFNDSDVYKWQEAAAYALAVKDSPALREMFDKSVKIVEETQMADGYINTYFQNGRLEQRLTNLNAMHEMYCIGHLIEAAVAAKQNIGDDRLLVVAVRCVDFLLSIFGPGKRAGSCGHEEIELALIKLADLTGEERYREFARWMVESRGHRPSVYEAEVNDPAILAIAPAAGKLLFDKGEYSGEYAQDHAPIRQHRSVVGHAVRAMYLYIAAAQLADGQDDAELEQALGRCWDSLTKKRMYVTGGIGPSGDNEGFTKDYDLPNLTAYAETCAALGLVFWGQAMLEQTGNSDYADVVERALYNGALSGISLDGQNYFYDNPLESRGEHARTPWFGCACCPPNLARTIGSLGRYVVGASDDTFFLNIPVGFDARVNLGGVPGHIRVNSNYPWSGKFEIRFDFDKPVSFTFKLRIPDWAEEISTELEGAIDPATYENGYATFDRTWNPGDVLKVEFEMEPVWIESNPKVKDNLGRVALTRGPLVYCLEEKDLGYAPQLFSADIEAMPEVDGHDKLKGIQAISIPGICDVDLFTDSLYAPVGTTDSADAKATFIPYFAWNNRGPNAMQVWVRRI